MANELLASAWQPYLGSGPRGYSQLGRGNWIDDIDVLGLYLDQLQYWFGVRFNSLVDVVGLKLYLDQLQYWFRVRFNSLVDV